MQDANIQAIVASQQQFFLTGATLPYDFRLEQLQKLKSILLMHEQAILAALHADLGKPSMEALYAEFLFLIEEINYILKHLKKWMRGKKVSTPLPLFPGRSKIHYEPYGKVLIISPWNYPFLLAFSPLIGAVAAGNCVILKPSEQTSQVQNLISEIITKNFPSYYLTVITGGPEQAEKLLSEKMDYVFFTGGTEVGKIVMSHCAKHLTPFTLELGGKSPCIVDKSADIEFAARRIAWAKTTNAGQTCTAPDFLYLHHSKKAAFLAAYSATLKNFFGEDAAQSASYGRIVNKKHFDRLTKLMRSGTIILGGKTNEATHYIEPTVIDNVSWDAPIMREEIFGPILPVMTFDKIDEVITSLQSKPKPLALYLFAKDKPLEQRVFQNLSFGGGCINDCMVHLINFNLPFGGVNESGIGSYHGFYSFQTFSHAKTIYKKIFALDLKIEYPPYTSRKSKLIRWLLRL